MSTPGAAMSTVVAPRLLNDASRSFWSVAATEMIPDDGQPAGYMTSADSSAPSLPAAATTNDPRETATATASQRAWE